MTPLMGRYIFDLYGVMNSFFKSTCISTKYRTYFFNDKTVAYAPPCNGFFLAGGQEVTHMQVVSIPVSFNHSGTASTSFK
eukprot:jgi/Botrbrau1/399/Bobra.110_2s0052.1